jgi:AraC-like DNA-binding protein
MIGLARELGVSLERCVAGTGLQGDDLTDPAREIAGQQELAVLRNILNSLDPEVPFGLLAGQRYRATSMGAWGFAIVTSANLGEALTVGQRYYDLTYSFNQPGFTLDGSLIRLLYDGSSNPDDLRAALIERDMAALIAMERDILGRVLPITRMQLTTARPAHAAAFEPLFGIVPEWNAPIDCIALDASFLAIAGPLADPVAQKLSDDLCAKLLERRRALTGVAGRVRARILQKPGDLPDMQTVATELGMTTRTLRNHLRREATSFRALVEESRAALAEELLATRQLTLDDIATRVGYADTSSFIAAFKRWKGVAPGGYRDARSG